MDSVLKAYSTHSRDPSTTSSRLILNPPSTEHPAPSSVGGPPALTQTLQETSQRRSPGPNAVTYEQDGTNLAEAPPPLTLTQTHTKFRRGVPAVAARRPPGSPWLSRRGAAAGAAGPILTHPSEGGGAARTSATSGVPSAAAQRRAPVPTTPARPGGTRRRPRR